MKRISALVFALCLLAVACGSNANVESAQQSSDPTATPSTTDPALGGGAYPVASLNFVITNGETAERTAMYTLSCLGDTATLTGDWSPIDNPDDIGTTAADRMCHLLSETAIQGRLISGAATDQMCTEIYGSPDQADVAGDLDAQPVTTTFDRSNGCGIDDWDNVMAVLLPAPTNA